MVFLGRCNCDINIQWDCVDKRHALLTYNHYQNNFQVKDLGTSAGTFINGKRIPDQTFIAVDVGDTLQLGDHILLHSFIVAIILLIGKNLFIKMFWCTIAPK
ncbi:hypothetical protein EB796_004727 [Bugula neritina]|uniref:FHA domain-containing protein n=1 Tax=Bugula neritina TaxID=10212 RepID=A0A7J7KFJ1_BUGNE|nr:hypothetical protein EB796_004727 [Bugula neritina]